MTAQKFRVALIDLFDPSDCGDGIGKEFGSCRPRRDNVWRYRHEFRGSTRRWRRQAGGRFRRSHHCKLVQTRAAVGGLENALDARLINTSETVGYRLAASRTSVKIFAKVCASPGQRAETYFPSRTPAKTRSEFFLPLSIPKALTILGVGFIAVCLASRIVFSSFL